MRSNRAEVERIGAEPAELEGIVARLRIDGAADGVAGTSVSVLPLPANSIAVPPVPMMAPPSKMLTAWALLISMPAEPEIAPKLEMPPVKVSPAMSIAVLPVKNLA